MFLSLFQYRHVFTDGPKKGSQYYNIAISAASGDHQAIKCSTKFFATGVKGGGGPVLVYPLDQPGGAVPNDYPTLNGHTADVADCDFNPFNPHLLVSFQLRLLSSHNCPHRTVNRLTRVLVHAYVVKHTINKQTCACVKQQHKAK